MNPILVKEVRAALRGRFFRFAFPIVVLSAVSIGMIVLVETGETQREGLGRDFFGTIYVFMCVALLGLVPFSAFLSMGSEWDEGTYDLLVISDMRPRQIVLGKLLSAAIEGQLYLSAFAPLLVFAFLLRGIDIVTVVVILACTAVGSISATAIALALSSLSRVRVARVLLLAIVAGAGVLLVVGASGFAQYMVRPGGFVVGPSFEVLSTILLAIVSFGLLGFTVACERLAHPEENHSTVPRLLVTFLLLVMLGIVSWMELVSHSSVTRDVHQPLIIALVLAAVAQVFFVTESETMTRRTRQGVPASSVLACLAIPFLPGGGRAVLLFFVHLGLALGTGAMIHAVDAWRHSTPATLWFPHVGNILRFSVYLFLYLAGTSLPFSRRSASQRVRFVARIVVPCLALFSMFVPPLIGFLAQDLDWMEMRHPFNPFYAVGGFWPEDMEPGLMFLLLVLLALAVLLLSLRRITRSIAEVLEASRERRARALAARAATAVEGSHVVPQP
jgi:hypothetical protein